MGPHTARRRRLLGLASAVIVVTASLGAAAPGAADENSPTTLQRITLVDTRPGMPGGYTELRLQVELSDPDGLPDVLDQLRDAGLPGRVRERARLDAGPAHRPVAQRALLGPSRADRRHVHVGNLDRDGRRDVGLPGHGRDDPLVVTDQTETSTTTIPLANGPSVVVSGPPSLPWAYEVLNAPVKVVTGSERWTPSLRLVRRDDGTPVARAVSAATSPGMVDTPYWVWSTTLVTPQFLADYPTVFGLRSSPTGLLTLPTYRVSDTHFVGSLAGWGSGAGRYYTVAAVGQLEPPVKWQARPSFSTSRGDVVMTGNAWPAPSVYVAANSAVHLQRLVGRTWRTEASSRVRANGRFTVVWDAPRRAATGCARTSRAASPGTT